MQTTLGNISLFVCVCARARVLHLDLCALRSGSSSSSSKVASPNTAQSTPENQEAVSWPAPEDGRAKLVFLMGGCVGFGLPVLAPVQARAPVLEPAFMLFCLHTRLTVLFHKLLHAARICSLLRLRVRGFLAA